MEEMQAIKILLAGLFAWLVASLMGCGVHAGGMTIGSTGFLKEVNAGRKVALEEHTAQDKKELNAVLNRRY